MGRAVDRRHLEIERILRREDVDRALPEVLIALTERTAAEGVRRALQGVAAVTIVTDPARLTQELQQLSWRRPLRNYAAVLVDAELVTDDGFLLSGIPHIDNGADLLVVNQQDLPVVGDVRGRLRGRVVAGAAAEWGRRVREALV